MWWLYLSRCVRDGIEKSEEREFLKDAVRLLIEPLLLLLLLCCCWLLLLKTSGIEGRW